MTSIQGKIVEVSILPTGTQLAQDELLGDTLLLLQDVSQFSDTGGSVTINGTQYTYTAIDRDLDTMTIAVGLAAAGTEGDNVLLYPPSEEKWAMVELDLGDDSVRARVPHWLADKVPDGVREEADQESVVLTTNAGEYIVEDVIGLAPRLNPSYIVGEIPAENLSDGVPPASSPTPTVIGSVGSFFLTWTPVVNNDVVTYKVYGSATPGFTKDASTLLGTTNATSINVRALANGSAFSFDTNYYFATIASDADGSAAASAESPAAQMMKITNEYVAASYVYAGEVFANQLRSGTSTADISIAGSFSTGTSGQRSVMDGFGIRQYGPDGTSVITDLPNAGNPKFTGIINAFGLTVNDGLELRGQNNVFAMSSITTLQSTIQGSATAPTLTVDWEQVNSGLTQYLYNLRGYHRESDGSNPTACYAFFGYAKVLHNNFYYNYPEITDGNGDKRSARGIHASAYVRTSGGFRIVTLAQHWVAGGTSGTDKFEILDPGTITANGVAPASLFTQNYTPTYLAPSFVISMSMGRCFSPIGSSTLENNFALVQFATLPSPDTLTFRRFAVTDSSIAQQGTDIVVNSPIAEGTAGEGIRGVVYGSSAKMGFPGTDQNLWIVAFNSKAFVWNATGTRLPDFDFDLSPDTGNFTAIGSTAAAANGFVRFEGTPVYNDTLLESTRYTNIEWANTDSPIWWVGYTWADANTATTGVTSESNVSTLAAVTMKRRARLTVTTPSLPDPAAGAGQPRGVDDVNRFNVYMQRQATTPPRTALWKQSVQPADLATSVIYTALPVWTGTTNPPASTTFPAQAAARFQSSAVGADGLPKVLIDGNGLLHGETLDISGVGATSLQGKAFEQLYYSIRAQSLLAGGGTISISASNEVKWTARFITIGLGKGANTTTAGYFDINMPTVGTVISGYAGATNKTVTSGGIPMNAWDALYYELPYGSGSASVNGNFRIVNYTTDFVVPNNWILICIRNNDSGQFEFVTGDQIKANQAVGGGWIDVTLTANFAQYNAGYNPQIRRTGNQVFFRGAIKPATAAAVTAVGGATIITDNQFCTIPVGYRVPSSAEAQSPVWVCQGSSEDRWALRTYDTGLTHAHRYGPGAPSTSSWLPFYVTWLLD